MRNLVFFGVLATAVFLASTVLTDTVSHLATGGFVPNPGAVSSVARGLTWIRAGLAIRS